MNQNEFRVLIKHCFLMGKNTVQAQQWLEKCYRENSPSKTTICRWYADFERGRTNTADAERPGRLTEVAVPENTKKNPENHFVWSKSKAARDSWHPKDIKRHCV